MLEGKPFRVAFNPGYLGDTLSAYAGKVTMHVRTPSRPAMFTAEGTSLRVVNMPIRTAGTYADGSELTEAP